MIEVRFMRIQNPAYRLVNTNDESGFMPLFSLVSIQIAVMAIACYLAVNGISQPPIQDPFLGF